MAPRVTSDLLLVGSLRQTRRGRVGRGGQLTYLHRVRSLATGLRYLDPARHISAETSP